MKYIFWLAASVVGYSYIGYPLWLWLRSRWAPRPVRRGSGGKSAGPPVSAVMVVRNEEAAIARKLENLLNFDYPHTKLDVVVVSDGSTDRTSTILADYARDSMLQAGVRGDSRAGQPSE